MTDILIKTFLIPKVAPCCFIYKSHLFMYPYPTAPPKRVHLKLTCGETKNIMCRVRFLERLNVDSYHHHVTHHPKHADTGEEGYLPRALSHTFRDKPNRVYPISGRYTAIIGRQQLTVPSPLGSKLAKGRRFGDAVPWTCSGCG